MNDGQNDDLTWPSALDALVAASAHHRLLLENAHVRVIEAIIPPGDRTSDHTHRWPSVQYICSWSDFLRRDGNGQITYDTRTAIPPAVGAALWSEPYPVHSVENIGSGELRVIAVEIKTTDL